MTLAELGAIAKSSEQTPEWKRKAIQASSTAGVVAAPAALAMAVRGARGNTGGVPREVAGYASNRLRSSGYRAIARSAGAKGNRRLAAGQALARPVRILSGKVGRAGKIGALVSGGAMVGLQAGQSAGDVLVASESRKKKPTEPFDKSVKTAVKGTLIRLAPNPTQQKALGITAAGTGGFAYGKKRQKRQAAQYDPYYGGY